MTGVELLQDHFTRIRDTAHRVVDGLGPADLQWRPEPGANPIGWLVWHAARVQDDHVGDVAGLEQCWQRDDWPLRFGLPEDTSETGFGHSPEQVGRVQPRTTEDLLAYLDVVTAQTLNWLPQVAAADLAEVVDESWDPPVTLGVRLVSVTADCWQHVGQAAYVRGLLART